MIKIRKVFSNFEQICLCYVESFDLKHYQLFVEKDFLSTEFTPKVHVFTLRSWMEEKAL